MQIMHYTMNTDVEQVYFSKKLMLICFNINTSIQLKIIIRMFFVYITVMKNTFQAR